MMRNQNNNPNPTVGRASRPPSHDSSIMAPRPTASLPASVPHPHPKPYTPNPRQRGTVLILVTVMLVLMVILAASFLGTTRRERLLGQAVKQSSTGDAAVDTTISLIGARFAADWLDYIDPPAAGSTTEPASEYHDYPNPAALTAGGVFDPTIPNDAWLATLEPEYYDLNTATSPELDENAAGFVGFRWWRQVSLLDDTDGFINANTFLPVFGTAFASDPPVMDPAFNPAPDGINRYAQTLRYIWLDDPSLSQTDKAILNNRMADADNDGYADSRWIKLPYNSGDGLRWIAAIRVIDNNAMVNVNTATAWDIDSLGQTPADSRPRRPALTRHIPRLRQS